MGTVGQTVTLITEDAEDSARPRPATGTRGGRLLISSHLNRNGPPPQALLVQENLRGEGYRCDIVGRGESGPARLLDVMFRGFLGVARADAVLVDVFGHRAFVYETLAILYARLLGRRVVVMLRGGWLPDFVEKWSVAKRVLALAEARVAPHTFLAESLSRQGIRIDRIIPNFINLDHYAFRERPSPEPSVLYLRGTASIYDPQTTLRAFGLLQERYPDARLTFAGSGPLGEVRQLAESLGLRNVDFVGQVAKDRIPELASRHDIYLQSNLVENMPISVLEMWACGVPVVCTDVGGTPYLVKHGVDGLVLPARDPAALAQACVRILEEPSLSTRLAEAGRSNVQNYSWKTVGSKWRDVLGLEPAGCCNPPAPDGASARDS